MKRLPVPERLPPDDKKHDAINVVIETPRGSRNKYKFDHKLGSYRLADVLPLGLVFPFDFGFIPSTLGEDGDPLDVLLLLDEDVPMGCVVHARLIGAIEAEQIEDGDVIRNDRLLAVPIHCHAHCKAQDISDLSPTMLDQIEAFFVGYGELKGKTVVPLARATARKARKLLERGKTAWQQNAK